MWTPYKLFNTPVNFKQILNNAKSLPEVKVVQTQQTTQQAQCGLITFEGLGDLEPVPPQNLGFTTATFDTDWISAIEEAAGGSIPLNNLPSPVTVAAFVFSDFKDIFLSNPISSVSLFYTSIPDVTLEVYDANGVLLSSTNGPGNYIPPPNTPWNQLIIDLGTNVISRIRVIGQSSNTAVDNIELCVASESSRGVSFTEF